MIGGGNGSTHTVVGVPLHCSGRVRAFACLERVRSGGVDVVRGEWLNRSSLLTSQGPG